VRWLLLTLAAYLAASAVYRRWPRPWTNPVALAVVVLLLAVGGSQALGDYQAGTRVLVWLLKPAVVALGYAMHREWHAIRRYALRFLLGVAMGAATSLLATPLLARVLGAPETLQRALAFKSVTSGIAVDLAPLYGADPALTVPLVILTGILGAALGVPVLRAIGVRCPFFLGTALGTASHGIGTARAAEEGAEALAAGGLAMAVAGLLTGLLAPLLLPRIGLG